MDASERNYESRKQASSKMNIGAKRCEQSKIEVNWRSGVLIWTDDRRATGETEPLTLVIGLDCGPGACRDRVPPVWP